MDRERSKDTLTSTYTEIERLENEYLARLDGLSKIFISLSAAILGLTLSLIGLKLRQQQGIPWILATWISLLITAVCGFLQVYSFSRRFREKANYLHACLMSDAVLDLEAASGKLQDPNKKLDEFLQKSHQADERFKKAYKWCVRSVLAQVIFLLLSFVLFAVFIWVNFACPPSPINRG